jgi:single-stranded DNA-binding protein
MLEARSSNRGETASNRENPAPSIGLGVNNVNLIGTLVSEPELTFEGARDVCVMQIEVPRRSGNGELQPGVIYVDVAAHGQQARLCASELSTGSRIGVSGTLEREDSLDSRGPRRSRWEVHANQIDFLDSEPAFES